METANKNNIPTIDEMYNLIIESKDANKTFLDNLDLWKDFYNNRSIIFKNNITNEKLFTIIKFLLEQEKGEIFDYFHSNILKSISHEQNYFAFKTRNKPNKTKEDINNLFTNLKNHDDLSSFLSTLEIDDIFGDIKTYNSRNLELDTIDSLIIILHNQFFNLEPKLAQTTLNYISKKTISFQNEKTKDSIMNRDLIFQYLNKILPIKTFLGLPLEEDELIIKLKKHEIKDKQIISKLLSILSVDEIIEIFENDLCNFLDFITKCDYLNEQEKQKLVIKIFDEILNEDCRYLLDLIVIDNQNPLFKNYLDTQKYNQIIILSLTTIITFLNSDMIKYLLMAPYKRSTHTKGEKTIKGNSFEHYTNARINFINQCRYLIKKEDYLKEKENFDIEGIKQILNQLENNEQGQLNEDELIIKENDSLEIKHQKTRHNLFRGNIIDFKNALELLDGYLSDTIKLDRYTLEAIIKSIATEMLNQLEIKNNGIYIYKKSEEYGVFSEDNQIIGLSTELIAKFLNNKYFFCDRIRIFEAMFHEIKHAINANQRKKNIWNIDIYEMEKELILRQYDNRFYNQNYRIVKEEITARINGFDMLAKFIETYLPEHLDKIQSYVISSLEKEQTLFKEQVSTRTMQFLGNITTMFNQGFDTLIKYNPSILKEHPILNLEYYPNGMSKSYENIYLSRNEENQDLIDCILNNRYPEIQNLEYHHKQIK
ncbi:MAG: hypothetical protein IJ509_04065 [Bacilli bacterium]|nr:hypothetical protein [Bacilli bacterium]